MEEVTYEGYGVSGVAVLVECITDNRNRTVAEVRHAFSKHGGNLGADGSVAYLFNRVGQIGLGADNDEEKVIEASLEAGAEDVVRDEDGNFEVITDPKDYEEVRDSLREAGFELQDPQVTMRPATTVDLEADDAEKVLRLLDALEDLDDTQQVYVNANFPEEVLVER